MDKAYIKKTKYILKKKKQAKKPNKLLLLVVLCVYVSKYIKKLKSLFPI